MDSCTPAPNLETVPNQVFTLSLAIRVVPTALHVLQRIHTPGCYIHSEIKALAIAPIPQAVAYAEQGLVCGRVTVEDSGS